MKRTLLLKSAAFALALILFPVAAHSYSARSILPREVYEEVSKSGSAQRQYYKKENVELSLVPDTQLAKSCLGNWTGENGPAFVVENLYLLPKSKLGSGNPSKTTIDYASKVIRSVSKMEGMTYFSHGDNKVEVLYKDCYRIKGPKDRTRLPDDTAGSADGKVLYCMQNDNSFGKTNYCLKYKQRADEVSAFFQNTTGLYVGPIKAVSEGNLCISLVITDCGDDMMVYMLVQADFPALKVLESKMNDSFSSRLDAIYKWFVGQF